MPALPRISCTTSSRRQPMTSVTGPSLPWPTPVMRSFGVERAGHRRRAAFDDVHDGDVVVDELQRGADALVVEAHLDAVFLGAARREVARVRIEGARVGVHQVLEHVVRRDLVDALQHALVALLQHVRGLRPALAGEHQRQRVVLHALAPELVQLGLRSPARAPSRGRTRRSRSSVQSGSVLSSAIA